MKKNFRVKREKDFKAIFKEGTSFANRKFVVYQLENQKNHFRVGLSVSKKLGNAVTRNQIKRRIRHIIQNAKGSLVEDVDFVVNCSKGVEIIGIRRDGEKSTPRIKIIKDLPKVKQWHLV